MVLFIHKTYHIMKSTQIKRNPRFITSRTVATDYSGRLRDAMLLPMGLLSASHLFK
jgi:hypothetical protein